MPFYIKWLQRFQIKQFIREEGPASHAIKAKTPTTGGVVFTLTSLLGFILFSILSSCLEVVPLGVGLISFLCALLGWSDDFAKVTQKSNRGLTARARLLIEMALGLCLGIILLKTNIIYLVPAYKFIVLPPWLCIMLCIFVVSATTNAVNLHDGMDGLAASTTAMVFLTLAILLWPLGYHSYSLFALSCTGALCGFLVFNRYPAKIFMGDTGSLFLGGALASIVLASGLLLWFIPLASIYILETLSVIAQVSYFKLTKPLPQSTDSENEAQCSGREIYKLYRKGTESKNIRGAVQNGALSHACEQLRRSGIIVSAALYKLTHKLPGEGKRLLRMAPLHHHFELICADKGIAEWQVVLGFCLAQFLICLLVLALFFSF